MVMKRETISTYYHNKAYVDILKQFADVVDLTTGMLHSQNGKRSAGINGRYEHIPCDMVTRVDSMFKVNPEGNFLDIGSGLGNILQYARKVGFKNKVTGIEINTDLKKYNKVNDVIWKDVFECGDIIKDYDLIWLYRPLYSGVDMDKLLNFIKSNAKKEGVIIVYESPHNIPEKYENGWYSDVRISEAIIFNGKYVEERKEREKSIGKETISEDGRVSTIHGIVYPF